MKILMKPNLDSKLVIMLGFQNTKTFLIKDTLKTGVFKIKNTVPWTYVISDLNSEPIAGSFHEKKCKKLVKKNPE